MRLGERVHFLLKKYNKSQKELAEFLNTKTSTINGWKQSNRNPSSEMIVPICKFFKISTNYFLTGNDEEFYENRINNKDEDIIAENQSIYNSKKSSKTKLINDFDSLSDESKKELEKYLELLKLKDIQDRNKDTMSLASDQDA